VSSERDIATFLRRFESFDKTLGKSFCQEEKLFLSVTDQLDSF
jgi:hypothetical protein